MGRPSEGKTDPAAQASDPASPVAAPERMPVSASPTPDDLEAALHGSACLGAWAHDGPADRLRVSQALAAMLGIAPVAAEVGLAQALSGIHPEDRPRIESTLYAATESGGWFEAEFRTRPGSEGVRWLRLMGRCERDPATGLARTRGLAFDLTEGRQPPGSPAQRAHRQVNQLADHVIAMQGLVASLGNPPLTKAVHDVAVEIGFELARQLHAAQSGPQH